MESKVLVTYASKYGSTQEVAEAIAATLRDCGLTVDIQPMTKVRSLAGYGALVLGAPLYFGAWHKDALNFLTQQQAALTEKADGEHLRILYPLRIAVFALGPTHEDEQEMLEAREMLDKELAKFSWLAPVVAEVFGGKYDPARLSLAHRLIAGLPASPLHGQPASDVRDWTAIHAWASDLPAKLTSEAN